jgi:hypothetical protein
MSTYPVLIVIRFRVRQRRRKLTLAFAEGRQPGGVYSSHPSHVKFFRFENLLIRDPLGSFFPEDAGVVQVDRLLHVRGQVGVTKLQLVLALLDFRLVNASSDLIHTKNLHFHFLISSQKFTNQLWCVPKKLE